MDQIASIGIDSLHDTLYAVSPLEHESVFQARRPWAVSSAGEHYLDTVGATSSILVPPTILMLLLQAVRVTCVGLSGVRFYKWISL